MRAGHIVYAVDNLEKAINEWREKGFYVEYARKSKKLNAIIYFSQGPFIELLDVKSIPKIALLIFSLFGGKAMVDRMKLYDITDGNNAILCIEKNEGGLDDEIEFLANNGKKGNYLKNNRRKTPDGKLLKWKLFMPFDLTLPFLMSYYNIDPKPKNFVHPNGVSRVKSLKLVTNKDSIAILNQLLDDDTIILEEGSKYAEVTEIQYQND
ncbi:hypothetical protein A6B44_02410 [Pasteurella skyensis]|nr:hypothetical protein A6B44_02410 [Pasteurella skyensis]